MIASDIVLDPHTVRLRDTGRQEIWCQIRKRWMVSTPEEIVRQAMIHYLISEKNYWESHIAVEKMLKESATNIRFDIAAYDREMQPLLLVECKAPQISINEAVMKQLLKYNLKIQSRFLVATNGIETYALDALENEWLNDLPEY